MQQDDDRPLGHGVQLYYEDGDRRGPAAVAATHDIVLFVFFSRPHYPVKRVETSAKEDVFRFFTIFQSIRLFNDVLIFCFSPKTTVTITHGTMPGTLLIEFFFINLRHHVSAEKERTYRLFSHANMFIRKKVITSKRRIINQSTSKTVNEKS